MLMQCFIKNVFVHRVKSVSDPDSSNHFKQKKVFIPVPAGDEMNENE